MKLKFNLRNGMVLAWNKANKSSYGPFFFGPKGLFLEDTYSKGSQFAYC